MYTLNEDTIILSDESYVSTLTHGSHKRIDVMCPRCFSIRNIEYKAFYKSENTYCQKCSLQKHLDTFLGKRFGRWTIIEFGEIKETKKQRNSTFLCVCDCGAKREVNVSDLVAGKSLSCGCVGVEKCSGKNSNFYKPELTQEDRNKNKRQRRDGDYQRVKRVVRKRDKNKCFFCGKFGNIVHHLDDFANHPELRTDPENLVCVCTKCHKSFHTTFGGTRAETNRRDNFYYLKDKVLNIVPYPELGDW